MSSSTSAPTTVLVTGAAGFIASHIVDYLLSQKYNVIGTSRTLAKGDKTVKSFKSKYPEGKLSFVAVPEIGAAGAFDSIFETHPEITRVIHTATPTDLNVAPEFYKSIIDGAVDGTLNILKSIQQHGPQVETLVITGSAASIVTYPLATTPPRTYTSADWTPVEIEDVDNSFTAYVVSKKYAEKATLKFIEKQKPHFNIVNIDPLFVFGPQVFDEDAAVLNFSNNVLLSTIKKDSNNYTPVTNDISIDVRDVAKFHVLAAEKGKANNGKRLLLGNQHFYDQAVIDAVAKNVPEAKLEFKGRKQNVAIPAIIDYQETINRFGGYDFIPFEKTVTDVVKQYVKVNGHL